MLPALESVKLELSCNHETRLHKKPNNGALIKLIKSPAKLLALQGFVTHHTHWACEKL